MYIMSSYPPPQENVPVFDAGLFRSAGGDPLSEEYLRTIFLQYPIAQTGLETLSETKTTGQSEFNGTMSNTSVIPYPDNTTKVPTTAWVNLAVAGGSPNLLPLNNVWTGTNEFQSTVQFDSALIISNGKSNTSLGNGFLPLAVGQGTENTVIGVGAGANGVMGTGNTVVGYFAASDTKNANFTQNCLFGSRAGQHLTGGSGNTLIGQTTGNNITTGTTNICLGNGAMANEVSGSFSNNIVIGNAIQSGASNRIIIGDTTQTSMDLQVLPTALGGGVIRMNNNLSMNNTTAIANRQISSSYYNFYATNNVATLTYSGRFYGNLNSIVYDCPDTNVAGSSNHIFYCYNGAAALNSLQISNLAVTSGVTQPAFTDSSTNVPTTAWVQGAISSGGPTNKQVFTYQFFNSPTTVPASTSVQMVVPYVNTANFSWFVRLEVNYALYANGNTTSAVDPKILSQIVGGAGQTNVNPNTQAIVDLNFAGVARAAVAQSTSSALTTIQNYFPTNQTGPFAYTPFAVSTVNASPTAGQSTVTLTIGFPAVPYQNAPTYQGNITTAAISIRIISSMTTATSTPTKTSTSSGIAYFV